MKKTINYGKRKGIRDIWNAFMVKECSKWNEGDIPQCPTARVEIPTDLITWVEAVRIHNKMQIINMMLISVSFVMTGYSMDPVEYGMITTRPLK